MTHYENCREWLESYRELRVEVRRLREKHDILSEQVTRITANLSPTPGGGGGDHERLLAALADADAETADALRDAEGRAKEIESFVRMLPTDTSRIILRARYLTLRDWQGVRRALLRAGLRYSEDHIYRLHKKALEEAESKWINIHKEDV